MTQNMKNCRATFFQIEDPDTRANVCENKIPESIKIDNGAVAIRFLRLERKQQLHQFKKG